MKPPTVAAALLLTLASALPALAVPVFVNGIAIPATTLDLSGDPIAINQRVGFFSELAYDPVRKEWWALGDRGPGGGTLTYDTRVQRFTVDIDSLTGAVSNFKVAQTVIFTDPSGTIPFNGLAPSPPNTLGRAFDPEGFVVNTQTGRFIVSDEYGPSVYEFNRDGTLARTFTTPANLIPRNGTTGVRNFADDTGNTAGKRTNRGFEGLAITPDGKFTYAMLQSAMLDEGGGDGVWVRIVKFDNATGQAVAQFAYRMEGSSQGRGISALVALNDHEFLVLERNNRGVGVPTAELTPPNKAVFRIDITGASDISGIVLTATGPLPPGFTAVTKNLTMFIDIDANTLAEFGGRVPEKWEGLAIGPELADGQHVILVGTDSDFSLTQNATGVQLDVYYNPTTGGRIQCDIGTFDTCVTINANGTLGAPFAGSTAGFALIPGLLYAYRSQGSDLASFVAQTPAPAGWAIVIAGLGVLALVRRRRIA